MNKAFICQARKGVLMSKIINGDITKVVTSGAIVQQVNYQGAMGAGVALAILKRWPVAKTEYLAHCKDKSPESLFGGIQITPLKDDLLLINSFSQLDYGTHQKQTNEQLLIQNIRSAARLITHKPDQYVYVPYGIGCGLAGGDWSVVYEGIKDLDNLVIVKF